MGTDIDYTCVEETFTSGGVTCAATVYRPNTATSVSRKPVIVMAHGFGAVRLLRLPAYAEAFAAAGYVVMTFDYRYFGDSGGSPRQLLDIPSQHADWRSALAYARTLAEGDPDRVIAWGTSFAGGHVLTLAGEGERLAAVIAQVPHVSGVAALRATGFRHTLRIVPRAALDVARGLLRRSPHYIPSIGPVGSTSVMATAGAEEAFERLVADSDASRDIYPDTVAARVLAHVGFYSPIRSVANIACPTLMQVAEGDTISPAAAARKAAMKIDNSTVLTYDGGHFDPYVEPLFSSVVADQLSFLRSVVPAA